MHTLNQVMVQHELPGLPRPEMYTKKKMFNIGKLNEIKHGILECDTSNMQCKMGILSKNLTGQNKVENVVLNSY